MSGRSLVFALSGLLVVAPIALRAQTLDSTMALANSAESAGDFSRAMTLYDHAYHLTGFDPGMLAAAGVSAARAGQGERAVDYFRRAVHEGFLDAGFLRFAERDTALATVRLSPLWMEFFTTLSIARACSTPRFALSFSVSQRAITRIASESTKS
jgi:hypothetical protein